MAFHNIPYQIHIIKSDRTVPADINDYQKLIDQLYTKVLSIYVTVCSAV